jgi:hypothetical protein
MRIKKCDLCGRISEDNDKYYHVRSFDGIDICKECRAKIWDILYKNKDCFKKSEVICKMNNLAEYYLED